MENDPETIGSLSSQGLQPYLQTPELLQALLQQLVKDFAMANVTLRIDCHLAYSFEQLRLEIANTLRQQAPTSAQLQNVFYRVDLTEKTVRKALHGQQGDTLPLMAELIIKRELQKVVIRYWYRNQAS